VAAPVTSHRFASVSPLGGGPAVLRRAPEAPAPKTPYDEQPAELRAVLEASFAAKRFGGAGCASAAECFNKLEPGARLVLMSIYQRLARFRVSAHLATIDKIWTSGVGGIDFTVVDQIKFLDALLASGQFCLDTRAGALLHPGTTSLREVSSGDSLHLTLGAGRSVSAHIDAISPAIGREAGGRCRYDPTSAAAHIGREVVPLGVPGLTIFPEPRPTHGLPDQPQLSPDIIRWEWRF
jgi:hypothetical protein